MPIEYDLVVIGASEVGIEAAKIAARYGARVALVQQGELETWPLAQRIFLERIFAATDQPLDADDWPKLQTARSQQSQRIAQLVQTAIADYQRIHSPAALGMLGIEVIPGHGEFCCRPKPGFRIEDRRLLRSRAFLLALPQQISVTIPNLAEAGYWTIESLLTQLTCSTTAEGLKQSLTIIGEDEQTVALAWGLQRLGSQVTLITGYSRILPQADPEAAFRFQAILEAQGICIMTDTDITQASRRHDRLWLQLNPSQQNPPAMATDAVVITSRRAPLQSLDLQALGVHLPLKLDGQLPHTTFQTARCAVYACPSNTAHPYGIAHDWVQRILLAPWQRSPIHPLALYEVNTPIPISGVGLTEPLARNQYGRDCAIVEAVFPAPDLDHPSGQLSGHSSPLYCKVITRRNGELLGAHGVGAGAISVVELLHQALQLRVNIKTLRNLYSLPTSQGAIVQQLAEQWHHQQRSHWQQEFWLDWFAIRRVWAMRRGQ
ncbi:FAD-dependent oxidoreductase [Alkalinema pantanalense CENA528]|uniref:FAD-dependent oxidoreductase n=1 Tax=Alkalinema pantanalense TaxID=1620705 RepID=UPI003D6EBC9E